MQEFQHAEYTDRILFFFPKEHATRFQSGIVKANQELGLSIPKHGQSLREIAASYSSMGQPQPFRGDVDVAEKAVRIIAETYSQKPVSRAALLPEYDRSSGHTVWVLMWDEA